LAEVFDDGESLFGGGGGIVGGDAVTVELIYLVVFGVIMYLALKDYRAGR